MARGRVTVIDWAMLALAIFSVGLLAYDLWGSPTPEQRRLIRNLDYAIIAVFVVEFSIRWAKDDRPKSFPLRNWYEIIGMIPVHHPLLRGFRLLRLVRIVVILSRFGRAADRAFGEDFTYLLIRRFKNIIVDAISGAVTLRVLDETEQVILKGHYTANMADALEAQGPQIQAIVLDKVQSDPTLGRLRSVPLFDEVVRTSSQVTTRIMVEALRDPRTEDVVKDVIRQNIEQIKTSVRSKEQARERQERSRHPGGVLSRQR